MKKLLVGIFWAALCAISFAQTYNQATFGIDYGVNPNQIGINFPAGWKPFMKVDPATGFPTINATWVTEGTFSMARFPSPAAFPGSVSATQPASTDSSTTLVSSSWVKQFFPSLVANVTNFGTPGMYWTTCGTAPNNVKSTCAWTLRQQVTDPTAVNWPLLTLRRDEEYTGGDPATSRPSALSIDYRTAIDGSGWVRANAVTMYNQTKKASGSDARQNVALAAIANRQRSPSDPSTDELTTNWALWAHAVDFTGKVDPTMASLGAEIDSFVMPAAGTDANKTRYGAIIGVGAYTYDAGLTPEHWAGLIVRSVNNGNTVNAIHLDRCGTCGGTQQGTYTNYITDEDGNLTMRANGTVKFSSATSDTLLELARRTSGNANMELNKPASGSESTIFGSTNGALRWKMTLGDSTAEGGTATGSNFSLSARNNDGTSAGTAIQCLRTSQFCGFGGQVNPGFAVDITGIGNASNGFRLAPKTVATLATCNAGNEGLQSYVTDSNATLAAGLGNIVAGGGANKVLVGCDGTNWRIGL